MIKGDGRINNDGMTSKFHHSRCPMEWDWSIGRIRVFAFSAEPGVGDVIEM